MRDINAIHGLLDELREGYGEEQGLLLWEAFNRVFDALPLVARIGDTFCMHGGIHPDLHVADLAATTTPTSIFTGPMYDIMWADPAPPDGSALTVDSPRGSGIDAVQFMMSFLSYHLYLRFACDFFDNGFSFPNGTKKSKIPK